MEYKVITFYKYVQIQNAEQLKLELRDFCEKNDILGRILLGEEGINGAASGKTAAIEKMMAWLRDDERFSDLTFRVYEIEKNAYHKLVVRVRSEIVAFGKKVDLNNKGEYVTPRELKELYRQEKDFVIIDARNDYEFDVGHFDSAIRLPIRNFRELPDQVEKLKAFKDKKVVMYCTGGIRCEKASAYLKEQGFKDVSHLKGGIIEFNLEFPNTNFKGANFVFDDRLVDSEVILLDCELCGKDASHYTNCHNLDCDRLYACCDSCRENMKNCCSKECMEAPRHRKIAKSYKKVGKVLNYFARPKIAYITLEQEIKIGDRIGFVGKTTEKFFVDVKKIYDETGNNIQTAKPGQSVTLPVIEKIRKNDDVIIAE